MVKEAVFSMIAFEVPGARVLDLFAGCGQMGIEALSRGAHDCVFVDNSRESLKALRENLANTGPWKNAKVISADAVSFLQGLQGQVFDIALLDPPYHDKQLEKCLRLLVGHMSENGVILCEGDDKVQLPEQIEPFILAKKYKYGKTCIFRYQCASS